MAPEAALPFTYGGLAAALGLGPPGAIARVTQALEWTMAEDAAAGRPFLAALAVSRARRGLPAPGFFAAAVRLGRFPPDPADHADLFHAEAARARATRHL